jgi:hypothetical protein
MSDGGLETDASGGQAVQDGRDGRPIAVAPKAVGTEGVDRHQEDVGRGRR